MSLNPRWLDDLAQDVRLAGRVLRRRAAFSIGAAVMLAVAIAANTVIFTVVDRALLQPLPYARPSELAQVFHRDVKHAQTDKATAAEVAAWRTRKDVFADVAFSWDAQFTLSSADHPVTIRAFQFSTNLFTMLGQPPALGRVFDSGDGLPGADHVVVLSDHLWRREFGASPSVVGRTIRLDDAAYTVIGVMPATFTHPEAAIDLWTPLAMPVGLSADTTLHAFQVVARLARGARIAAVQHVLPASVALQPLRDAYLGPAHAVIWLLQGAVALVVLITGANIANLVLAHATTVQREVALREALGASATRLARQFVTQALILCLVACGAGVAIAWLAADLIFASFRELFGGLPAAASTGISWGAVALAIALAIAAAAIFGMLTAVVGRSASRTSLQANARAGVTRRADARVRGAIISAQIAVSVVLLTSSVLLVRTFLGLEHRALGFATENRLTFLIQPDPARYAGARAAIYIKEVLGQIRALPGVRSAAGASAIPLTGIDARRRLVLGRGSEASDSASQRTVHYRVVSPEYFSTMSIPRVAGRLFDREDRAGGVEVALVNETAARKWAGENPIGKVVTIAGGPAPETVQIVGVVGDVRHGGLALEPEPEIYRPIDQAYWPFFAIVVHTAGDAAILTRSVENAVWSVDHTRPIDRVETLQRLASQSLALRRISMIVLTAFAGLAALLTGMGTYGVISYVVSLRTREIGIRVALGADPGVVMRGVLGTGARLVLAGAVVGILATLVLTRYLASLLFGVSPTDVSAMVSALALATMVALAATFVPARRAARIDPALTLRTE